MNTEDKNAFLQNTVDWQAQTMQQIARTLELPDDATMKDLATHAVKVMAELKILRAQNAPPNLNK